MASVYPDPVAEEPDMTDNPTAAIRLSDEQITELVQRVRVQFLAAHQDYLSGEITYEEADIRQRRWMRIAADQTMSILPLDLS